jgi:hypothetical protein
MITIYLPDARGFWISGTKWNHAPSGFAACMNPTYPTVTIFNPIPRSTMESVNDWRWIGWAGWYGTEENKKIYEYLKSLKVLDGWQYGEYDELEDLSMELIHEKIS